MSSYSLTGSSTSGSIKCVNKAKMDPLVDDPVREYELMSGIAAHPCIALALDIFQDAKHFFLVYEHLEGGDFTTLTQRASQMDVQQDEEWWRTVFLQCFL